MGQRCGAALLVGSRALPGFCDLSQSRAEARLQGEAPPHTLSLKAFRMPLVTLASDVGHLALHHRDPSGSKTLALEAGAPTLILAALSWRYVEQPALQFRKRFVISRHAVAAN